MPNVVPTEPENTVTVINDISFSEIIRDEKERINALHATRVQNEIDEVISDTEDKIYHAMIAHANQDQISYRDAMQTKESEAWQRAVNDEL